MPLQYLKYLKQTNLHFTSMQSHQPRYAYFISGSCIHDALSFIQLTLVDSQVGKLPKSSRLLITQIFIQYITGILN